MVNPLGQFISVSTRVSLSLPSSWARKMPCLKPQSVKYIQRWLSLKKVVRVQWRIQGGRAPPLAPKIFFLICSFQAILRENPNFWQIVASGPP